MSTFLAIGLSVTLTAQDGADAKPAPKSAEQNTYPAHWGNPPLAQTKDYRPLPSGYGMGSGTLAKWITKNMEEDRTNPDRAKDLALANAAEIKSLEAEIKKMQDSLKLAKFTEQALADFKAMLQVKEERLATLKASVTTPKKPGVPTFEEWIKGGKKIPKGMMFLGGTPWFNESTGTKSTDEEVYQMLFGN